MEINNPFRRYLYQIPLNLAVIALSSWLAMLVQRKEHVIGAGLSRLLLFLLINAQILVAIYLLTSIVRQGFRLFIERKKGLPGAVFKQNLLFSFMLLSVLPAFFIVVSAGKFITQSIDGWFRAQLGSGMESAATLFCQLTATQRSQLAQAGDQLKIALASGQPFLSRYEQQTWRWQNETERVRVGKEVEIWRSYRLKNNLSTQSLEKQLSCALAGLQEGQSIILDFYGSTYFILRTQIGFSALAARYPKSIRDHLITLQTAQHNYAQLRTLRYPILTNYVIHFILIALIILFLAIWTAFYLARGISAPLEKLIAAVSRLKQGSFDITLEENAHSDLQTLTAGFNQMVIALREAQEKLTAQKQELLLMFEHLSTAVFFINRWGRIVNCNPAGTQLVERYLATTCINKKLSSLAGHVAKQASSLVRQLQEAKQSHITQQFNFTLQGEMRSLVTHITVITQRRGIDLPTPYLLVVVEDVSDIVKINKLKTWQEAAKQIAHEIKNPLTPIQLATQRLARKCAKALPEEEQELLRSSCSMILTQVDVIKNLASHFYAFASLPAPEPQPLDIAAFIQDVFRTYQLSYPFITFLLENQLPTDFTIMSDAEQLRRVFVNLIDNSLRALGGQTKQNLTPRIWVALAKADQQSITATLSDNGPGISPSVRHSLFLPYVSTEKKNMGLGLAITQDIIKQLGGSIRLLPTASGASFAITLPT